MITPNSPRPHATGLSLYRGLPASIYILFVIRVFNRFGDFVQILLVLILTGKLGLSSSEAGLFVSASILATMFGQLLSAYGCKRWRIKSLLLFCQLMVSISYMLCALCYLIHPLFIPYLILFASPFRGGTAPLTNTMVAQFSKPDELSRSFSLLYLGTNVGIAIGPVVASLLYVRSLFLLFLFSSCLLLGTTLLLFWGIKHIQIQQGPDMVKTRMHIGKPLWLFFGFFVLYSLLYGQNTFTLPLQFSELFGQDKGSSMYASLMMVNAVTVLVAT
ncbi:MAG: MFS transporter, partial [Spirochaetia bacterium]|nr:MFS transporter [Spirochaetia bacterium]